MYDIQRLDDINGSSYSVVIPKDKIDKNALYTIMYEKPDFLVSMSYRTVNDNIELSYHVGNLILMKYLARERTVSELPSMWRNIILPLDECRDYFMEPLSLVLQLDYVFCDKRDNNKIKYLYIPVKGNQYSNMDDLKNMIEEILDENPSSDMKMENQILKVLQNFSLDSFVAVINSWEIKQNESVKKEITTGFPKPELESNAEMEALSYNRVPSEPSVSYKMDEKADDGNKEKKWGFGKKKDKKSGQEERNETKREVSKKNHNISFDMDLLGGDFELQLGKQPKVKEEKSKKGLAFWPSKSEKSEKPKEKQKEKKGLFGKKNKNVSENEEPVQEALEQRVSVPDNYLLHLQAQKKRSSTELLEISEARLLYIGEKNHPREIDIEIDNGKKFIIGRVDKSDFSLKKDFEFPIETKAVSRKHAVIIKEAGVYYIDDLSSKAGTYVDGNRVSPNYPVRLNQGSKVSFGTLGADYVWEENENA